MMLTLSDMLLFVHWKIDPVIFTIGPREIRWYGLLFAAAFIFGNIITKRIFKNENVDVKWLDSLNIYMLIGTVVGARLGHVFFYEWGYYSQHLSEIPKVWEGGLASHGAAIGIILSLVVFSIKVTKKSLLWILDIIVISVALAGFFIRLGNLMNHEIIGEPTDVSWAFIFYRVDLIPRHPSQLYESIFYLVSFLILFWAYWKRKAVQAPGLLFGMFLILVFSGRFFIEFFKENQVAFEDSMSLNMGQILSIPLVAIGVFFVVFRGNYKKLFNK